MRFKDLAEFDGDPLWALEQLARRHALADYPIPTTCTLEVLGARMRLWDQIDELSACAPALSAFQVGIIRAPGIAELGFCYSADVYPELEQLGVDCLLALNLSSAPDCPPLVDLVLHEFAHAIVGEGHGWQFLSTLNVIRHFAGLPHSRDPYDCCEGFNMYDFLLHLDDSTEVAMDWCAKLSTEHFQRMQAQGLAKFDARWMTGRIHAVEGELLRLQKSIKTREDLFAVLATD